MTEVHQANLISKEQRDTINSFFDKIHLATINEEEWVEISPEIIKHYNKQGLGRSGYFIFQGIKVCEYGKKDELQKGMSRQIDCINHGDDSGHVNQITKTRPVAGGSRVG